MYDVADEFLMRKADVKGIIAPMFGSGLAGGDWGIIKQLIHEHWLDENIDVTITTL
jgi:hypothetical protein